VATYFPKPVTVLGTDGYGRSDNRGALRDYFEVDAKHIALAAVEALYAEGKVEKKTVTGAVKSLGIDANKPNPLDL
jgi:pyruvate dehydrogenase E1 component